MKICLFIFHFFVLSILAAQISFSDSHASDLSLLHHHTNRQPATGLIAALDGTLYLLDTDSGRVIWSFSTGSPIYHSYLAPLNSANESGLIECGDDWELILHHNHFGKTRLSESIADYVADTPVMSEDGAVVLGSKRTTVFEVDAKTGRLVRSYTTAAFDDSSAAGWSDDRKNVATDIGTSSSELADPAQLNPPEFLLKIFRTDYLLQSVGPGSGMVLWTMKVAEFKAVLHCQHDEYPSDRVSFEAGGQYAFDSGLRFAMPYACHDRKLKDVYRQRKNFLLEHGNSERLSEGYQEFDMLPTPSSELMLPLQPNKNRVPHGPNSKMMLPGAVLNHLPALPPKINYDNNDHAVMLHRFPMDMAGPGKIHVSKGIEWSTTSALILFIGFILCILIFCFCLKKKRVQKDQNIEAILKSPSSKKKRARKSGRNAIVVDKQDRNSLPAEEDILTNNVDGRKIGKLIVLNKEIAKGSNGTIVLEGIYEGREVAVKRLVQAHHDVASKEIQNLIASDCHPNIVRWYGVEYDNDFVYLALERCICNLDDLIQNYSDISENPVHSKDQGSKIVIKAQVETGKDDVQYLWKASGHPSSLLLKLMRDVISGLAHLHELGIIHRDLKPQNVLITKERSLCAKLSDMGISKRLLEDMSTLGHSVTGCGSSGWQAPEQLVQGRQSRALDLFSLGCVLFFCMTGGRHPFGERLERDVNILKNRKDLFLIESIPEAEDLISRLLNPDPNLRPKAIEVLHHPLFWSSEMRLSFLRDASDRVELEDRETDSDLLRTLESIAPMALGAKWDEKMEPAFITNIGRYRRYKYDSVRDLLRVMRNKLNHYRELPQEIQELVGSVPEGFNDYFASRFPRLLIEVYRVIYEYCKEDQCFQRYFRDN
ncbi:serine/threonine-protein kinase/endoribonuclease IRE1a-like isoform X2 [Arachis hypogaea]|uniref:serine/threonine-protein kinase/endoribonuclease IRE1a-like isoform X2 n=1 Tax=Arachis hypogaea TaxID=3818 RepID=UPI0010FC4359|nr:serine/threonine-protein kinase/endoribonuclease IRE1a-like isoform X2 [Arachis hypogaea]XP_029154024.1 serine/threonine-protein kinase/endoribonuclease IRE1a-like isoform X2 [Arachis hypogaea]QHO40264.1 Serine/threonine-protein kinase/endoribonuclease IRE1a [Arachis hypogaea]